MTSVNEIAEKVEYFELLPHEFRARLAARPVGYLPMGTLEWHGEQNALGADALQSHALFVRAAVRRDRIPTALSGAGPDTPGTGRPRADRHGLLGPDATARTARRKLLLGESMAHYPRLVDLSQLAVDRSIWPQGVAGEDPRDATAEHGEECIEASLTLIGAALATWNE